MIIAFIGVVMLGLWSLLFKQYRLAMYVHIFCMGFATVWIEMSAFLVINKGGFKKIKHFHHWFGLLIISFLFIQNILGIIIWIIKKNNKTSPKIIYIWNWVHRVLGIILIIMALIQIGRAVRKDN
jgi:heme A synthase